MSVVLALVAIALMLVVFWDAIETVILPRTVARRLSLSTVVNEGFFKLYTLVGRKMSPASFHRERLLGTFGPLALVFNVIVWALLLIFGFALLQFALSTPMTSMPTPDFGVYMYHSAETFFTLGYGDVAPVHGFGRGLAVFEAGTGFGFLALIIGYIPVLYSNFSRREATILLLDARAGSPPTAGELLRRYDHHGLDALEALLSDMEKWSAGLLESYLSYPALAFYRSQHEKMSWLSALTMVLDACSLLRLTCDETRDGHGRLLKQAELSYALARHVIVDLSFILDLPPLKQYPDRLPHDEWLKLCGIFDGQGLVVWQGDGAYEELTKYRRDYEPFLFGLSETLFLPLPPWLAPVDEQDNWRISAWDGEQHF